METSDLLSRHLGIRIARLRIDVDALLSGLALQGHPMNELEQATQVYREAIMKVRDRTTVSRQEAGPTEQPAPPLPCRGEGESTCDQLSRPRSDRLR